MSLLEAYPESHGLNCVPFWLWLDFKAASFTCTSKLNSMPAIFCGCAKCFIEQDFASSSGLPDTAQSTEHREHTAQSTEHKQHTAQSTEHTHRAQRDHTKSTHRAHTQSTQRAPKSTYRHVFSGLLAFRTECFLCVRCAPWQ